MTKIMLNLERPIAFFPQLSKALGGIEEAIFVQQLYFWSDKCQNEEGWIYKTQKEWEFETTLTPKMQNRLKRNLINRNLLLTKLKSVKNKPILHYKLDIALLQKVIMQYDQREESNMTKGNKHHTETTTETTTDNNTATQGVANDLNSLINLFEPINPSFDRLFGNKTQRAALTRLVDKFTYEKVAAMIKALPEIVSQKYAPRITSPYTLEAKLGDLIQFTKQTKKKGIIIA